MDMVIQGLIAAVTILWLFSYIGYRRVFGYAFAVDVLITGGFMYMFAGSYAGMMTGLMAGLFVSIALKIGGRVAGKECMVIARRKGNILPSIIWVRS